MISPPREVVITGIGATTPIGIGMEAVEHSLATGASGVRPMEPFNTPEFPVRIGGEVVGFDPKQHVTPRKSLKVMSRGIQLAFAAAQMAIEQAGVTTAGISPDRFGVVFGAEMMQAEPEELVSAFRSCIVDGKFEYERWDERALSELFPLWMLKYLPNMPACHIAIAQDARGPNNTIVLSEVSSLLAITEGMRVIERGHADAMIVGGTGSRVHPLQWAFRDRRLQTSRFDEPGRSCRPFDAHRDGMVYGEGAAAYLLESRQHAEARRAKILARILGSATAFEACVPGEPFSGTAIRTSITQCLRSANVTANDVGHVNAHGLSTIDHDRTEAQAIRDTLGDVPVTAPKSFFGNLGAGTGAVELLASMVALRTGQIPFTLNYEEPDPLCPINVVGGQARAATRNTALIINQALMGQSAALLLAGPN